MIPPTGPIPARVMVVGEAPGEQEEARREPFIGTSGLELTRMLQEAGISRGECFITNVCRVRPPQNDISHFIAKKKKARTALHVQVRDKWVLPAVADGIELLKKEIDLVKPNVIIACGNVAMWALTGQWGVAKWRGSLLQTDAGTWVIPVHHPAAVLRQWELRNITVHDLRRAAALRDNPKVKAPAWNFRIRPTLTTVTSILTDLLEHCHQSETWLELDLETRAGHIACCGLSWSNLDALCIPLMCQESREGYWSPEEEAQIIYLLYQLLTHQNVRVRGQNLLYDLQYIHRYWHFLPRVAQDTMLSHHVAFAGMPKALGFLASMYCEHYIYWKDDGKDWASGLGEDQLWRYNCLDCVRTREVGETLHRTIQSLGLSEVERFQQALFWPVLQAMLQGVRIDKAARNAMSAEVFSAITAREDWFSSVLGHSLNPRSPMQMQKLFYEDLKLPVVISRKSGKATLDDAALNRLAAREPLILPLVQTISDYRSLGVFLATFIKAPLDQDQRMRCSFNIAGTETYRFSSSRNPFNSGTNLQNIPKGGKLAAGAALPNIRKLFIPDPGYTFFDGDLDRADLQVVVWEANDAGLKLALRQGIDMHCLNACAIYHIPGIPPEELVESHPNYKDRRASITEARRQVAKSGVHAVNYGCKARTLATNLGLTVHSADQFIRSWFSAHPGILNWHQRVEHQLHTRRWIANAYGYRRFYFDRVEGLLPEALAWIPQSTVACTVNRIFKNIYDTPKTPVRVLLQVHDSLAGQFPTHKREQALHDITTAAHVVIPYPDPLVIPFGVKLSERSWGDCR